MLPFTTYNIPEDSIEKTAIAGQWLIIIVGKEISDAENMLLGKICTALKNDPASESLTMVIPAGNKISLASTMPPTTKLIISFGVPVSQLGVWIDLPEYGYRHLHELMFISTLPLHELEKSATAKKQLWSAMQKFMETR